MSLAEWALHYIAQGHSIMPLHHPTPGGGCSCGGTCTPTSAGKHPVVNDWSKRDVMTADEARAYWTTHPDANIGIRTGGPLRLVVLDADGPEGIAALETLDLPPTAVHQTGNGRHYLYTLPPDVDPSTILNSVGRLAPHVDVRCEGGQIVAPPSLHYSGRRYEALTTAPPVPLPPSVVARLPRRAAPDDPVAVDPERPPCSDDPARIALAAQHLLRLPSAVEGQHGGTATYLAAMAAVRGFQLTDEAAYIALQEYNARAQPPWDPAALRRKISEAARTGKLAWGAHLPRTTKPTTILSAVDIFEPLPPITYQVQGIGLTPGAPLLIAGYGYSGKTAAAQQLAIDLATPDTAPVKPRSFWDGPERMVWAKLAAPNRCKVLHLDYEQGSRLTRWRYQRLAQARGLTAVDLDNYLALAALPEMYLDNSRGLEELERIIQGWDVVIVDSFRAASPGVDENSSDARMPLDAMTRLSERSGASFVVIHHARKPNQDRQGGTKMSIRGSGAIFDGCASVLVFDGEKDQPKVVSHEKERNSGVTLDDFELVIADDPKSGGLTVRAKDVVRTTPQQRAAVETNADVEKIRRYLATHPFFTNREQIRAAMGVSAQRASAAIGEMLTSGELVNDGGKNAPHYHLSGQPPRPPGG